MANGPNEQHPLEKLWSTLRRLVIGKARDIQSPKVYESLTLIAFLAWVGLGSDGLSSSNYGPQEAFVALQEHYYLGIFVALVSAATIWIIGESYVRVMELFPTGGGGYFVASKLLTPHLGMVSGCALLIDYVLTIAISIASGADALFSFLPLDWQQYKLPFASAGVVIMVLMNLRGVRESVVPLVPIFLIFLLSHGFLIVYGIITHSGNLGEVAVNTGQELNHSVNTLGLFAVMVMILKAYSMGAGTYTGIEAVSNSMSALSEPRVRTAKKVMFYMMISLSFFVVGLMLCYMLFRVQLEPGKTLNAVLLEYATVAWSPTTRWIYIRLTLFSAAAILFIAAQTGFLGGPRVLANMALDRWLPTRFAILSDRLVMQNGILIMGIAAFLIMLLTGGDVTFLVVLYSINVFITFTLTQTGMVRHWWLERRREKTWGRKLFIAALGMLLSGFILVSVTIIKFSQGGWITLVITGSLILVVLAIRAHYNRTGQMIRRFNQQVFTAFSTTQDLRPPENPPELPPFDPAAKTAVILVNGFNGLGLHTLFTINRLFTGLFKNFVFVQVGVMDAGNFKGITEVERLREISAADVQRYETLMRNQGFHTESAFAVGVDPVIEIVQMGANLIKKYPNAIFFGGQMIFRQPMFLARWLHNNIIFEVQRRFYQLAIPVVILPIRI